METYTLVFDYRGITYNEYSAVIPRIGESIMIEKEGCLYGPQFLVTGVVHRTARKIVYLTVKKTKK